MLEIKCGEVQAKIDGGSGDEAVEKADVVAEMKSFVQLQGSFRGILVDPNGLIQSQFTLNRALFGQMATARK